MILRIKSFDFIPNGLRGIMFVSFYPEFFVDFIGPNHKELAVNALLNLCTLVIVKDIINMAAFFKLDGFQLTVLLFFPDVFAFHIRLLLLKVLDAAESIHDGVIRTNCSRV